MGKNKPFYVTENDKKRKETALSSKNKKQTEKKSTQSTTSKKTKLRIPSRLERLIEEYIEYKTKNPYQSPVTLNRIRQYILAQKAGYWNSNPKARYGKGYDVFAYLAYQAPGYLIQFKHILKFLDLKGVLPKDIILLDLGTGPGVVPLATIWYQKERKKGSLTIHAIERSIEFLEAFRFLVPEFIKGTSRIYTGDVQSCDITVQDCKIPDNITVLSCQNVLAELSHLSISEKAIMLMKYCSHVSEEGLIIIIEPAELRHSIELRKLQKELENRGLFVYAPCRMLRQGTCDYETCWSFEELPPMNPTRLMNELADEKDGYRFINQDIKFSFTIFTKRNIQKPLPSGFLNSTTPLSELQDHLGELVNVTGVKMSRDIGNPNFSVFLICDGASITKTYLIIPRVLRNDDVKFAYRAGYGEILTIQNVRVRWNEKKNAFNLVSGVRTRLSATNI